MRGFHWAADVLSVGLRNYGILKLAQHGIYRFNSQSILTALVEIGIFKAADVPSLFRLREHKRVYRRGAFSGKLRFETVEGLTNLVSGRIGIGNVAKRMSAEDTVRSALFPASEKEWYSQSRRLEAALFSLQPAAKVDFEHRSFETEIERFVRSPADYGWRIKTKGPRLSDQLRGLVSSHRLERW
jgi:hypothetical protein